MSDFREQYALWDEFLEVWPATGLATMTLDEYTQAESKDSFTYWIEQRLKELGGIGGGSAFKFGVFSRSKNTEEKENGKGLSYSDTHGWCSSLGETAEEAFEKVRRYVVQVATLAAKGDVDGIGAFKRLGEAFKWKIAFHYQNRQKPVIVDVFKPAVLAAYTGGITRQGMAALQKATLAKRPVDVGILEYGQQVWEEWKWKQRRPDNAIAPSSPAPVQLAASKPVAPCINRIYYGPPGTGKTYTLTRLLKRDYEQQMESVSTEEWRNQIIAEKIAVLKWWEGIAAALYDLGGKAKVAEIAGHRFIQAIAAANTSNRNVRQTLRGTLQSHTLDESTTVKMKRRQSPAVFDKTDDSVWLLAGDWEDSCADLKALVNQFRHGQQDAAGVVQRYSFVTFHQSYGYEEFVEGLRPVLAGETEAGEVAYEIRPGAFKELCRKARQVPDQRFAMVIDEINRGNISKIFGELITLIEADKRDPLNDSAPPAEVILAYSGEKFSVPANVDIIGTMNTADRSLALLDTALRRRFEFVALPPDTRAGKVPGDPDSAPLAGLVVTIGAEKIDVRQLLERINERIEALYDRDHCIGHAYLTGLAQVDDGQERFEALTTTFRHRIVPLLEEYFFEDWRKIRLVLGDNQKKDATIQFVGEGDAQEQDLTTLFGNDHGLDSYAIKRRYSLQESAFSNPAAYIGIYRTSA